MKNAKIIVALLAACICQPTFAYARNLGGFYVDALLGGSNLHYSHSELERQHYAKSVNDRGFAGRIAAGFDISQNLGLELGFIKYQNPEFKSGFHKADFSQDSLDLVAKLSLPVSCSVSVLGKAGMAYVYRDDAKITVNNMTIAINEKDKHLRPILGLGVNYAFNCRVSGELAYYRTFGTDDLEDADFYGAGVIVRLG